MRPFIVVVACGFLAAAAGVAFARDVNPDGDPVRDAFILGWWTVDGGGGPAAGGDFELLATVGQADVGTSLGDEYVLQAGFLG